MATAGAIRRDPEGLCERTNDAPSICPSWFDRLMRKRRAIRLVLAEAKPDCVAVIATTIGGASVACYFFDSDFIELPLAAPVVEPEAEPESPVFIASNTDMPCGPIVIKTGSPSLDFACTTKDSATTLISVKPASLRSWLIFWAAARFCVEPVVAGALEDVCGPEICANADDASRASNAAAVSRLFMGFSLGSEGKAARARGVHDAVPVMLLVMTFYGNEKRRIPFPKLSGHGADFGLMVECASGASNMRRLDGVHAAAPQQDRAAGSRKIATISPERLAVWQIVPPVPSACCGRFAMPRTGRTPSIVPYGADQTIYLVIDRCRGGRGRDAREAELERTDLETIIADLIAGQFVEPIRVVAFNTLEHWSEDISRPIALELQARCDIDGIAVPEHILDFVARHTHSACASRWLAPVATIA